MNKQKIRKLRKKQNLITNQKKREDILWSDIFILMEDFNAKILKEDIFLNVAGKETMYQESTDNGERLRNLAAAVSMFIMSKR